MLIKGFDETELDALKMSFQNATPFRFLIIDNFLDGEFAEKLFYEFPPLEKMDVNYKGINEHKSEHSNFNSLDSFSQLKNSIADPALIKIVEKVSDIQSLELIDDRYGYGLHQGGTNSFLDVHIDYNLHPIKKKLRRLNLILFLNKNWKHEWGGALEFWNKDVNQCVQSILPVFNRCVIFECNNYSYHGYSKITSPVTETRKSYYQYFFTEPDQRHLFHDTIFKSKPEEKFYKKMIVSFKELLKNGIKSSLYHLRITKFFK